MKKGFTLVELLVVVAIIIILTGVGLQYLGSVRSKSRDAKRFTVVKNIEQAVETYYQERCLQNNCTFPTTFSLTDLSVYIGSPEDPSTSTSHPNYSVAYDPVTNKYCIGAKMENANYTNTVSCDSGAGNALHNYRIKGP